MNGSLIGGWWWWLVAGDGCSYTLDANGVGGLFGGTPKDFQEIYGEFIRKRMDVSEVIQNFQVNQIQHFWESIEN